MDINRPSVRIGGKIVIDSGTCVAMEDNSLFFDFADDFKIRIAFCGDGSKEMKISSSVQENVLVVKLTNFNNPLGSTNADLLRLGTLNRHVVYLSFALYRIGNDESHSRVFHYCFLMDEGEVA